MGRSLVLGSDIISVLALFGILTTVQANENFLKNPIFEAIQTELKSTIANPKQGYVNFGKKFNRVQTGAEAIRRQKIFLQNVKFSEAENAKESNPYILGINKFSDLTFAEFQSSFLLPTKVLRKIVVPFIKRELPICNVDWRTAAGNPKKRDVITSVKNQGHCGSCWAFAAVAQLESSILMKGGAELDLSEQEVLNCNPYNDNCNRGGWATNAWTWMRNNNGIARESQVLPASGVPYLSGTGVYGPLGSGRGTCVRPANAPGTRPVGWTRVTPHNDNGLIAALKTTPVKVGLYAGPAFQHYVSGVITCSTEDSTQINHEIQAVGCSTVLDSAGESRQVYIVKNSWGTTWGNSGFAYIQRYSQYTRPYGACGIASDADWLT